MKEVLSMILAIIILFSTLPVSAFENELSDVQSEPIEQEIDFEGETLPETSYELDPWYGSSVEIGEALYYIDNDILYYYDDNVGDIVIAENVTWVIENEGEVYYSRAENFNTYICKADEETVVAKIFCPVECFDVYMNNVYYSYNGEIFEYIVETAEETVVRTSIGCSTFIIDDNGSFLIGKVDTVDFDEDFVETYGTNKDTLEDKRFYGSNFTNNSKIQRKLDELFDMLPYNKDGYNYFTTYGNESCGNNACDECQAYYVLKSHPVLQNLGITIPAGRWSCYGFAHFVIKYIFGIEPESIGTLRQQEMSTMDRIGSVEYFDTTEEIKALLDKAKVGDYIQMFGYVGYDNPHSAIYLGNNPDGSGVIVLQSNMTFNGHYKKNRVTVSSISYNTFVSMFNSRVTIYRCPDEYYPSSCDTCATQGTKAFKYAQNGKCPDCDFKYNHEDTPPSTKENGTYIRNDSTKYKKFYLRKEPYDHYYNKKGEQISDNNLVEDARNYSSLEILGLVKNADGGEWFKVKASTGKMGYIVAHKVRECFDFQSPYSDPEITFDLKAGDYPTGTIEPKAFTFTGVISSKYDLWKVTVEIYNADTNKLVQVGSSTFRNKMDPNYDFAEFKADDRVFVQNLADGNYYIRYNAWDLSTEDENIPTAHWDTPVFTVVKQKPSASVLPSISSTSIRGGVSLVVTASDSSATIHVSGGPQGEVTESNSVKYNITEPGTWSIKAWTTASGKVNSGDVRRTVSVSRTATPNISNAVYTADSVYTTISGEGEGEIRYTVNGSTPTEFSALYNGPITLEKNQTIKAISISNGKSNSQISEKKFMLTVPNAPVVSLTTEKKVAQGGVASVSWDAVDTASSYTANLMVGGNVVDSITTTGTKATFTLPKTSDDENVKYTISVVATNCIGDSRASNIQEVTAMHPVTVTVVDRVVREGEINDLMVEIIQARVNIRFGDDTDKIEGNVVSVQRVPYGTKASKPATPSKNGFTFAGYSEELYYPIFEDTTVFALYDVNYYTASFYDTKNGKRKENPVSSIQYMYSDEAIEPSVESLDVADGYIFSGWFIDSSVSDGIDFKFMEGDMVMDASYSWEFDELPVFARIDSVVRDNRSYDVTVSFKNTPNAGTNGIQSRVIAALYTEDGKCVATQLHELDTDFLGNTYDYDHAETITILYDDRVTSASVYVVGVVGGKTSGTLSPVATSTDITLNGSGFWESTWSEWQDEYVEESNTCQVKTKTVYRYSDKEFTETYDSATLDGWYQNGNKTVRKTDKYQSSTYLAPEDTAYRTRTVKKVEVYRDVTQWRYSRRYGISANDGKCYAWPGISGICTIYEDTGWLDYRLPVDPSSPDYHNGVAYTCYNAAGTSAYIRGNKYWWHEESRVISVLDYVYYDVVDTYYTYSFWRWGDWSDWLDYNPGATNTRKIESKTQYSYRRLSESANGAEEESVFKYNNTVTLDTVTENLAGKRANVMVYKKTNTDPTEEQMEYISQEIIGEGNTISFEIDTREKPHYIGTGDFVVALAVEGSNKLINIDYIEADKPLYTVKFLDDQGNVFHTETVSEGGSIDVNAIGIPELLSGVRFLKWDKSLVYIKSDMTVSPVTEMEKCAVVFVDYENQTTEVVDYRYGDVISHPANPTLEGHTFDGWDGLQSGANVVSGSVVLTAKWIPNKYTVEFRTSDDEVVSSQQVYYGESAVVPEPVEISGVIYNWDSVSSWWKVTNDMVVYPYIPRIVDIAAPEIEADLTGGGGSFYAELSSAEGNRIFYSYYQEITDEIAYNYAENLRHQGQDSDTDDIPEMNFDVNVPGILASFDADGENTDTGTDDSYIDYTVYISEYNESINVSEGMILYTFSMDADYQVSPVAVYEYGYGEPEPKRPEQTTDISEDCPAIMVPDVSANPGETVSVPVTIVNNPGIRGLSLIVGYDMNSLKLVGIENGDVFEDQEFSKDLRDDGSCKFVWESDELNTNCGTMATLTFLVGEDFGNFDITIAINEAVAPSEEEQPFATVDGIIKNEGILMGDVNGDGEVDFADGIRILKHDVGLIELNGDALIIGDVNGDGEVDFADAILILKFDVGLISSFKK